MAGSDVLKIGVVGCGRRGRGAVDDCMKSAPNVQLVAMGDIFKDNLDGVYNDFKKFGEKFKVTPDKCFDGFDAYQKVIHTEADVILLVAPPGFRPLHLKAAIEAGKHVFMEKPVAVDPVGARSIGSAKSSVAGPYCGHRHGDAG